VLVRFSLDWVTFNDGAENENVAEALAVCAGCDVRAECLAAALADPNLVGVWGGTTSRERRELRVEGVA
jgi:hypothetical protein